MFYNSCRVVVTLKKTTKKLFTLILATIIFTVNANVALAVEFVSPSTKFESPTLYDAASSTLDLSVYFDLEEFNDYMVEQLKTLDGTASTYATIDLKKFNIPKTDAVKKALQELIWYNSPELFRIDAMGFSYTSTNYVSLSFYSHYTKEEYTKMHTDMLAEAEKLLNGIKGNTKLTDVEKALLLHDRLIMHCEYDYDTYKYNYANMPQTSYNAYGVFVLRDAVCMGYALAYDYLLEQVGIKSLYCSSDTINHAWNIVYIDGTPYHVDTTWDDPIWDVYGQVLHENFLLSTNAFIETGHNAKDFFSFPTDTTYDNFYWNTLDCAFQRIDNEYYYYDRSTNSICKRAELLSDNFTIIKSIPASTWTAVGGGYWPINATRLSGDGHYLYYNTNEKVYKYDPKTNTEEVVFEPDLKSLGEAYWIYGMMHYECQIVCDIFNTPNFNETVRANYRFTQEMHTPTDEWVVTKEPTVKAPGTKSKLCSNCSLVLETEEIPAISLSICDESVTFIDEKIIFTSNDLCSDINELISIDNNLDFEVQPSLTINAKSFYGTGSVISIYEDELLISHFTVVVNGDLNGDSVCDVMDAMTAELCATNNKTPSAVECYAANGYNKDTIDAQSYQYIVNTAFSTH